jgi:transposase
MTPIGRIHREDPEAGLRLLIKVTKESDGDPNRMAKKLGVSLSMVRKWHRKYEELRKVSRESRVKAAQRELRAE